MIPVLAIRSGTAPDLGKAAFAPCNHTGRLRADGPFDGQAPRVDQSARPGFGRYATQAQRIAGEIQLANHSRASHRSPLARPVQHGVANAQGVFRHLARGAAESFLHQSVGAEAGVGFRRQLDVCGSQRESPQCGRPLDGARSSPGRTARRFRASGRKSRPDRPLQPPGNPRGSGRPCQLRAFDKSSPAVGMRYTRIPLDNGFSPRFPNAFVPVMFCFPICPRGVR